MSDASELNGLDDLESENHNELQRRRRITILTKNGLIVNYPIQELKLRFFLKPELC